MGSEYVQVDPQTGMASITMAKRLVRELLRANLPAELDLLDHAFDDGVITVVPEDSAYYTAETATVDMFPQCEIVGLRSMPQGSANMVRDYTHELSVIWTCVGDTEETLVAQVERYILATRNITFRTQLDPSLSSAPMLPGAEDYGMLTRTKQGFAAPLLKGAAITVSVRTLDDGF